MMDRSPPALKLAQETGRTGRLAMLAFPVLLWFISTLFFFGDIGKWNDDYWFHGQIVPETQAVRSYVLDRPTHFWRPAYRWVATPLITAMWNADQANHWLTAAVHGFCTVLVYLLLRRVGIGWHSAMAGTFLFLLHPAHYEPIFWNTSMFTPLATCLVIGCVWMHLWSMDRVTAARAPLREPAVWASAAGLAVVTFIIAAMNEQPAAYAAGLPAISLAIWWVTRARGRLELARLFALGIPAVGACLGVAGYLGAIAQLKLIPTTDGAASGMLVTLSQLPDRLGHVLSAWSTRLSGGEFLLGAWAQAFKAIGEQPLRAAICGLVLAAAGVLWVRGYVRREPERQAPPSEPVTRRLHPAWWIVLGAALFVAVMLPLVRMHYPMYSRLYYVAMVGAALVVAGAAQWLTQAAAGKPNRRRVRIVVGGVLAVLGLAGTAAYIGIQHAYRLRYQADMIEAKAMHAALANVPPGTILVPLTSAHKPVRTGQKPFDEYFSGALHNEWSAGHFTQWALRRSDVVSATVVRFGSRPLAMLLEDNRVRFARRLAMAQGTVPRERTFKNDQLVVYRITDRGTLEMIEAMKAQPEGGAMVEVTLPRTRSVPADVPRVTLEVPWHTEVEEARQGNRPIPMLPGEGRDGG